MTDHHIHFEKQPYTLDLIDKMVKAAQNNDIEEIYLLDHTHKFSEFEPIYSPCKEHNLTWSHYQNKRKISIQDYLVFIDEVKKHDYPVKLKFGLEVCYFRETEDLIRKILSQYHFDFLIGAIHHIDGMAYDLEESYWDGLSVDLLYQKYYENTKSLIQSRIFTHLAHPDAIKRFNKFPTYSLKETYEEIADLLIKYNLPTENNTGFVRYHFNELGMNSELYKILKSRGVKIYKSSDAHEYSYIGYAFEKIAD